MEKVHDHHNLGAYSHRRNRINSNHSSLNSPEFIFEPQGKNLGNNFVGEGQPFQQQLNSSTQNMNGIRFQSFSYPSPAPAVFPHRNGAEGTDYTEIGRANGDLPFMPKINLSDINNSNYLD